MTRATQKEIPAKVNDLLQALLEVGHPGGAEQEAAYVQAVLSLDALPTRGEQVADAPRRNSSGEERLRCH